EEYLISKKGLVPEVARGASIIEEVDDGRARYYEVRHQPCCKFRVIIPLETPWIAADYESQEQANAAWRERVGAVAHMLGLNHDQSCADTSRLFYLPRIKTSDSLYEFHTSFGMPCPIWTLPPIPATDDPPDHGRSGSRSRPHHVTDLDGNTVDLKRWAARYARRFEIVTALRTNAPEIFGDRRNGVKHHIECPCVEDHITDQTTRTGTFCVNASQVDRADLPQIKSGFVIQCSHAGCARTDRLGFLAALLRKGCLTANDLTDEAFLTSEVTTPIDDETWPPDVASENPDSTTTVPGPDEAEPDEAGPQRFVRASNIPPALYTGLPDVLGEMHTWLCKTSPKPQPPLLLGACLAFMAAAIGQRVKLEHFQIRPNLYALGVAYSGAGKERGLSGLKEIARAAGAWNLIGVEEMASDAGIVTSVFKQPAQVMLLDEVSYLIQSTHNAKAGAHVQNITATLLKLYSASATTYQSKSYADIDRIKVIDQPCVSMYGCSTPDGLFSALQSKDITSGLLSRCVLFHAGDHDPLGMPPADLPVPDRVVAWVKAWRRVNPVPNPLHVQDGMPVLNPMTIRMTQEALDIATDFEAEMHALKQVARARGTDALYVRARENALKFALVRACAVYARSTEGVPEVDRES
ncbi:hypothetical protein, partial [Teichococcus vastitatis]|uniref:hypothetical protein n=1 Tax=Teichococcus vastitatis TaxID=2307076 RepID=UPI001300AA95